jgi:1,4-dihydroxy-6-naphthoate synthase
VTETPVSFESLSGRRIGIPGFHTTAYLTLRLLLPTFEPKVVPISPFTLSFDAIRSGAVDAALLIHEGRLTYEREGFHKAVDIGEGWSALTGGLPLPLGGNVIRRGLGSEKVALVSRLCRESIAWALRHREEVMAALLAAETRAEVGLDRAMLDRYLTMYANEDTREFAPDARLAVTELFARGVKAGLLPEGARAEFSE